MCYLMFGVVESFFCLMSQNNEETNECGPGSAALHSAGEKQTTISICIISNKKRFVKRVCGFHRKKIKPFLLGFYVFL